jgi:hypothetical protein
MNNCLKIKQLIYVMSVVLLIPFGLLAGQLPSGILARLNAYNVSWNELSTTGSKASMPLGNGDITANVWVERNGDLVMYIGKSDAWSEGTRLLKIGRVRIHLTPNPFIAGMQFSQTLNLYGGEINISAGQAGAETRLKVWIDANHPVIRVEASGDRDFSMQCSTELLRPVAYTLPSAQDSLAPSFRGLLDGAVKPSESADVLMPKPDRIEWYHRNTSSFFKTMLEKQNVADLAGAYPDPYLYRTFGAAMLGDGMKTAGGHTLQSIRSGKHFTIAVYAYTAQTETASDWDKQLSYIIKKNQAGNINKLRAEHYKWWDAFWNRSWIFLSGDDDAVSVTRGYLLQRFMEACQGRGAYPIKFNGGTLTFDYDGKNGDYRNWGPAYWNQNNRHLYWPLLATGDSDLLKPWFDCYMNMLPLQTDVTRRYYHHGGAFFPETFNFFGLYIQDDWGWANAGKRSDTRWIRYHYSGGLEVLAQMLDFYNYTRDRDFAAKYIIPYATQVIRFFDQHWERVNGTIKFYPANSIEEYWDCTDPTDYIAGLRYVIPQLAGLPGEVVPQSLRDEWNGCLAALPPIPMDSAGTKILPARTYDITRNSENPECYTIFPYKIYGIGRPGTDTALRTFGERLFKWTSCWSQDPVQAPLLGLADLAKKYVADNSRSVDSTVKFPAFWASKSDYIPDFDNGGTLMMAVQNMLIQNVGSSIYILPGFPPEWSVDCKLLAYANTTVRLTSNGHAISALDVVPLSRKADIILPDSRQNQYILFPALPAMKQGDPDMELKATSTAGLKVSYTSSDSGVATIANGKLHVTGTGRAIISAVQEGDQSYNRAPEVKRELVVAQ